MTREEASILLKFTEALRAFADGKPIQVRCEGSDWMNYDGDQPHFFNPNCEWRAKPEPREFWIAFGKADGLVKYIHSGILPQPNAAEDTEIIHVREITEP